jgi:hypothetical protein
MLCNRSDSTVRDTPRRFARDLIVAVLENMRRYQEPLMYSVIAPSRFLIYLHPSEFARLEGIIPLLREQTIRGLADEVDKVNRRSTMQRYAGRLRPSAAPGRERDGRLAGRVPRRPGWRRLKVRSYRPSCARRRA